jgi:hypothetical protein
LGDDVSGYKTFTKPLDDNSTSDPAPEGSLYRNDGPQDLAKHQDNGDDTIDHSLASPGYFGLGDRDPDDSGKTKYPYRDDKPNTHNAAEKGDSKVVAALYVLAHTQPLIIPYREGKTADTADQILTGLNPEFLSRSKKVKVSLKRVDAKNLRWLFEVQGNHTYAVKLKAIRPSKATTRFSKMNLELSCTCPAWQWQGPEFHGKQDQFQLGKLRGTASSPDIRDPDRINKVCKHVAAVLSFTQGWEVPLKALKKQAVRLAMKSRLYNVRIAQGTLEAPEGGYVVSWIDAPQGASPIHVRATGKAEFASAAFQLKRAGESWPEEWIPSSDLAGSYGRLGFDSRWENVPGAVKAWVLEDTQTQMEM